MRAADLHLQRGDRPLGDEQLRRKLLLVALRLVAHRAEVLDLRINFGKSALQFDARFAVSTLDPGAVELRQRQVGGLCVDGRQMKMPLRERGQDRQRTTRSLARRKGDRVERDIAATVHHETMRNGRSIGAARVARSAAAMSALFHSAALASHGTVTARG